MTGRGGKPATGQHVLKRGQEGGRGPEAARLCTPRRVDLALELTEGDWGLCHEAARLERTEIAGKRPSWQPSGRKER